MIAGRAHWSCGPFTIPNNRISVIDHLFPRILGSDTCHTSLGTRSAENCPHNTIRVIELVKTLSPMKPRSTSWANEVLRIPSPDSEVYPESNYNDKDGAVRHRINGMNAEKLQQAPASHETQSTASVSRWRIVRLIPVLLSAT